MATYDSFEPPRFTKLGVFLGILVIVGFGYLRIILERIGILTRRAFEEKNRENYSPVYKFRDYFFKNYIFRPLSDIFNHTITGNPGGTVRVLEHVSHDQNRTFLHTGRHDDCINLASYDYLGFSSCVDKDSIGACILKSGVGIAPLGELGARTSTVEVLERMMAQFVGTEACMVFGMGFATNSTNISSLISKETLILVDQHAHASIRFGLSISCGKVEFFKHNDFDDLEQKIRSAIINESSTKSMNTQTQKSIRKIIIIVEGVYSMEGTIVDLPRLIKLKRRYKCYLYVDEAHSIGAVGPRGKGVCDYFGIDPTEVDLLMGTMTKSFAAAGGYIAGSRELVNSIRANSAANYAGTMAAPIAQQIINVFQILMDREEGERHIAKLLANTRYMRKRLQELGFVIGGNPDSPVIPIMVYYFAKINPISREAKRRGLAFVGVGYPATGWFGFKIRLCMSAAISKENLDRAIGIISEFGDQHRIKYNNYHWLL